MSGSNNRVSRRWLYIPFAIAGVVLLAYFLLWRFAANEMEKAVYVWVDDQREAGLTVNHGDIRKTGFPFFLRVIIADPAISSGDQWRWRGDQLALDALPYDLNRLIFSPGGKQDFEIERAGLWAGEADDLRASIANDETRGWVFALTVEDGVMTRAVDGAEVSLGSLVLDLAPSPDDATTLTLNLASENLRVAQNGAEYAFDSLNTSLALTQTEQLTAADPAGSWRDAGGVLIIARIETMIDDAAFTAQGEISLDDENFPTGAVNAEIKNPGAFTTALAKARVISRDDAIAAAAGLTLMAMTSGGTITAPVEMAGGAAMIGGVKIADLPRVY